MKIAIAYDIVYPYGLGGGEKRNWEVARRLAKKGHDVELIGMQMWHGEPVLTREGVRCTGVCLWRPGLSVGGKRSFWEPLYFARRLYSYLRRTDVDVVDCSNFPYLSCLAARAAMMFGRAGLVITWYEVRGFRRWVDHRGPVVGLIAWLFERLVSHLTAFNTAISPFTAKRAQRLLGMKNVAFIPCGVDFTQVSSHAVVPREDQILYVGRLTRYKRVDLLLAAFALIAPEFAGCTLKIVGRGYERSNLEGLVERLGLGGKVVFADSLSEDELYREYARSRVFVLPSEQEGFGIVLLEAMAVGTPVIALDAEHSAAGGLVTHGVDGLLVSTRDDMAAALRLVLTDAALWKRLSEAGLNKARDYDWDGRVIPELENYYRDVVARKAQSGRSEGGM